MTKKPLHTGCFNCSKLLPSEAINLNICGDCNGETGWEFGREEYVPEDIDCDNCFFDNDDCTRVCNERNIAWVSKDAMVERLKDVMNKTTDESWTPRTADCKDCFFEEQHAINRDRRCEKKRMENSDTQPKDIAPKMTEIKVKPPVELSKQLMKLITDKKISDELYSVKIDFLGEKILRLLGFTDEKDELHLDSSTWEFTVKVTPPKDLYKFEESVMKVP
jgi:hypothetical protein